MLHSYFEEYHAKSHITSVTCKAKKTLDSGSVSHEFVKSSELLVKRAPRISRTIASSENNDDASTFNHRLNEGFRKASEINNDRCERVASIAAKAPVVSKKLQTPIEKNTILKYFAKKDDAASQMKTESSNATSDEPLIEKDCSEGNSGIKMDESQNKIYVNDRLRIDNEAISSSRASPLHHNVSTKLRSITMTDEHTRPQARIGVDNRHPDCEKQSTVKSNSRRKRKFIDDIDTEASIPTKKHCDDTNGTVQVESLTSKKPKKGSTEVVQNSESSNAVKAIKGEKSSVETKKQFVPLVCANKTVRFESARVLKCYLMRHYPSALMPDRDSFTKTCKKLHLSIMNEKVLGTICRFHL